MSVWTNYTQGTLRTTLRLCSLHVADYIFLRVQQCRLTLNMGCDTRRGTQHTDCDTVYAAASAVPRTSSMLFAGLLQGADTWSFTTALGYDPRGQGPLPVYDPTSNATPHLK